MNEPFSFDTRDLGAINGVQKHHWWNAERVTTFSSWANTCLSRYQRQSRVQSHNVSPAFKALGSSEAAISLQARVFKCRLCMAADGYQVGVGKAKPNTILSILLKLVLWGSASTSECVARVPRRHPLLISKHHVHSISQPKCMQAVLFQSPDILYLSFWSNLLQKM